MPAHAAARGGWALSADAQIPLAHTVLWGSEHKSGEILTLVEDFILPRGCLLLAFLSLVLLLQGFAGTVGRGDITPRVLFLKPREVKREGEGDRK